MRRAFSATEVMVAVMVAATIGIPLLTLLFQERDSEQRSRYEYLALLAARDAAFTARALVACGQPLASASHGPEPLASGALESLKDVMKERTCTSYSDEQKRITVEVKIDNPANAAARVAVGTVTARWVDPELAKSQNRRSSMDLTFGVNRPPGAP